MKTDETFYVRFQEKVKIPGSRPPKYYPLDEDVAVDAQQFSHYVGRSVATPSKGPQA